MISKTDSCSTPSEESPEAHEMLPSPYKVVSQYLICLITSTEVRRNEHFMLHCLGLRCKVCRYVDHLVLNIFCGKTMGGLHKFLHLFHHHSDFTIWVRSKPIIALSHIPLQTNLIYSPRKAATEKSCEDHWFESSGQSDSHRPWTAGIDHRRSTDR